MSRPAPSARRSWACRLPHLLPYLLAGLVLLVAALVDPGPLSLSDLRIHLIGALQPLAEGYGLPSWALVPLIYGLVGLNILLPVYIIAWLRHRAGLSALLAGRCVRPAPWPERVKGYQGRLYEQQELRLRSSGSWVLSLLGLCCLPLLCAAALWARDRWRVEVLLSGTDAQLRLSIFLEALILMLGLRAGWHLPRRILLQGLRRLPRPSYWSEGWLLHPPSKDAAGFLHIKAQRLPRDQAHPQQDWSQDLARHLSEAL